MLLMAFDDWLLLLLMVFAFNDWLLLLSDLPCEVFSNKLIPCAYTLAIVVASTSQPHIAVTSRCVTAEYIAVHSVSRDTARFSNGYTYL